ncbi:pentapeptide repeat-containing protein [Mycetocola zhadangensis]|uniref:pentapeptide repeat-containing protein n=1 Tax=Mycetocola zhadangensis TaxID=1164595 RepID=UPI00160374A2|nr:pentapeptide repeat-containing protein [Mycetocola zhadangensis]
MSIPLILWAPAWMVFGAFPWNHTTDSTSVEWANALTAARQSVLWTLGGLVALVGVVLSLYRNRREHLSVQLEQHRQFLDKDRQRLESDRHWTSRYTDAIGQLGDVKSVSVRLGGIYALERLASEAAVADRQTILDVLAAYLRESASMEHQKGHLPPPTEDEMSTDTAAVATVLARLTQSHENAGYWNINLHGVDLHGANLEGARLPSAHLDYANLEHANLRFAVLEDAGMHFVRLTDADLHNANCRGAHLPDAALSGASLGSADLSNAYLNRSDLSRSHLSHATLTGANLSGAIFDGAHLNGADLSQATGTTFEQLEAAEMWDESTRWPDGHTPSIPAKTGS